MANANSIIKELLLEEKVKRVKKGLKVFYNIDIFIKDNGQEQEQPTEPVGQAQNAQAAAPAPAPVAPQPAMAAPAPMAAAPAPTVAPMRQENVEFRKNTKRLLLREDEDIDKEKNGAIEVIDVEVENIQTMEDLVDFLSDKKKKDGQPIFNEFCSELVLTLSGSGEMQLSDLLRKEDKVLIDIDYGSDKTDSVGFKVLKRSGVQNISIMMKKDGNILPGKFDINDFNTQIITYRNSVIGDGK
jgi:hypothetical protein